MVGEIGALQGIIAKGSKVSTGTNMEKYEILSSKYSRHISLCPKGARLLNTEVLDIHGLSLNQGDQNVTPFVYGGVQISKSEIQFAQYNARKELTIE